MKKIFVLFTALLLCSTLSQGQNDTLWKTGGVFNVMFSQVSLSNWAAGGENSVALNGLANLFAYHKKGNTTWDTNLDLGFGLTQQGEESARKNDDRDRAELKVRIQRLSFKTVLYRTFQFQISVRPGI